MKSVIRIVILICFLPFVSFSQSSAKLKKEQNRLEQKIADTKLLLDKSKDNTESSLNELKIIENQIAYRAQLLRNYDNQIRSAELSIKRKEVEIIELEAKITRLKIQYKQLLIYAYKHRNKYGKMMYLFSADDYNEALKRKKYLEHIAEIQKKQFLAIQQSQEMIREQIAEIDKERAYKKVVIAEKGAEKAKIEEDRKKQQAVYEKFKQEEDILLAKLKEDEQKKAVLKNKIAEAIKREIAEAEARRKAAEEAARKKREAEAAKANATKTTAPVPGPELKETKEAAALSASFEGNRGKLPWPVSKGSITEKFGKNPHPTLKEVYTNNRGIDISAPKNAQVRAVFTGEVTSVLNIPGAGKVVIIKHGNYRTVYSNLQDAYVNKGDKVSTKQVIGSLLGNEQSAVSVAHFEIHKVVGAEVTCLNPSLWVSH